MSDWIIFESLFVFAVWMQRKHRWRIFGEAMSGKYTVAGSVRAGSQAYGYTTGNDGNVQSIAGSGGPSPGGTPNSPSPNFHFNIPSPQSGQGAGGIGRT